MKIRENFGRPITYSPMVTKPYASGDQLDVLDAQDDVWT